MRFIIANAAPTQYQRLSIFQMFVGNLFLFSISVSAIEISPGTFMGIKRELTNGKRLSVHY